MRVRVRTLLIVVAALSLPLGYFTSRWRRNDFAFQKDHLILAERYLFDAGEHRAWAAILRQHAGAGHRCATCAAWRWPSGRSLEEEIADEERQCRECEREAREHLRWVGSRPVRHVRK